jgi:hypothetical protein
VEVGAGALVSCCVEGSCFMEEEERGDGRGRWEGYPTSMRTNVSASRTLLPFVPPWGFDAFSSFDSRY